MKNFLLWIVFFLFLSGIQAQSAVYRRFLEAEEMVRESPYYQVKKEAASSNQAVVEVKVPQQAESYGRLSKTLEQLLPAGEYVVWVKTGPNQDNLAAGQSLKIRVGLGETSDVLTIKKIQPGTSASLVLKAGSPFQTIWLAAESFNFRFQIDRLYLSNQLKDVKTDTESATVDLTLIMNEMNQPGEFFPGFPLLPPEKEPDNWLENGSFEVGIGSYFWSTSYQQCYSLLPDFWEKRNPAEGERCLALKLFPYAQRFQGDSENLPTLFQLLHKILKLYPEKKYYFRGLFRASEPVDLTITVSQAYEPKTTVSQMKATVGENWQPVLMEFKTLQDNRGYFLSLSATAKKEATLYLDALSLSAEKREDFLPSAPVEIGVHWQAIGRVFYQDQAAQFLLLARNYQSQGAKLNVSYQVFDYFDRLVLDKNITDWAVPARSTAEKVLDLNSGLTGCFRLVIRGEITSIAPARKLALQEYVFSVVPRPPARMNHSFGAYITLAPEPLAIMSRAGIRRTVTLSCSNELLQIWRSMEPKPGEFVWTDKRVDLARELDMDIIANLDIGHQANGIPDWARNPAVDDAISCSGPRIPNKPFTFSRKAWANFVEKVVQHYRGKITNWLIVDEPYHYMKPEEYADLIKTTYLTAKKADPDCRIFIHGGYYPYWLPALEKAGAFDFFDGISDYARTKEQGQRLKDFSRKYNKPVLNVEYRWQVSMYRTIETPDYIETREVPWYQEVTETILQEPVYALAWSGGHGFNLYDARYPGGDFRQLDKYKCGFEYDGALKPNMVAYAIMSQLLDGFHGVDELQLHPDLKSFLLKDEKQFALVLWTKDNQVLETRIPLPEKVKLLDIMGNPCPDKESVLLTNSLSYLIGPQDQLEKTSQIISSLKMKPAIVLKTSVVTGPNRQYFLRVNLTNNSQEKTISGKLMVTGISLREFWKKPIVSFPALSPGKSMSFDFGLNSYLPDLPPKEFDGRLLIYFEGGNYQQVLKQISD